MAMSPTAHIGGQEIGGYFGLDLPSSGTNPHSDAIALNSARNSLLYTLRIRRPARVFLPSYICGSMLQPLKQAGIPHHFYAIDERLQIAQPPELGASELLVYVNYFGLQNAYCRQLAATYGQALVIDNSQALYADPQPCAATIYSPRKFVGVSDGGYLYTEPDPSLELEQDTSSDAARHLSGRADGSAAAFYQDYRLAEQRLAGRPLRRMSTLTAGLLAHFDHHRARLVRERNFLFLHSALERVNRLPIDLTDLRGPMAYPLWTHDAALRGRLLEQRVYTATYWSEVLARPEATALERELVGELVPLPIDQRYGLKHMGFVLELIKLSSVR